MRYFRWFFGFSAAILLIGSAAHARAFPGAARAAGQSALPAIYGNDFKALWLGDSATLLIAGLFFAATVVRPSIASRAAVCFVAAIPAATAIFIFVFVGNFYAGYLLLFASAAAVLAAAGLPKAA